MEQKVEQFYLIDNSGTYGVDGWPEADCALVQVSTEAHAVALSA